MKSRWSIFAYGICEAIKFELCVQLGYPESISFAVSGSSTYSRVGPAGAAGG